MNAPITQAAQPNATKATRLACLISANLFSAASVWAAYLGAAVNVRAYMLAFGLAVAATLLFRYHRRVPTTPEPLWTTTLFPTGWGLFAVWELRNVLARGAEYRLDLTIGPSIGMFAALLLVDLWFSRSRKTAGKT